MMFSGCYYSLDFCIYASSGIECNWRNMRLRFVMLSGVGGDALIGGSAVLLVIMLSPVYVYEELIRRGTRISSVS